jgi:Glycosyl hydrolases family 32 N-terminal domain
MSPDSYDRPGLVNENGHRVILASLELRSRRHEEHHDGRRQDVSYASVLKLRRHQRSAARCRRTPAHEKKDGIVLRLDDRWAWDSWIADTGSDYHLFFLNAPRSLGDPNLRHRSAVVGHAVSSDLVHWEELGHALGPGPEGDWDDVAIWTGSVIRGDDAWYSSTRARRRVKGHSSSASASRPRLTS